MRDREPAVPAIRWVDGELVPADRPVIRADDSAYTEGVGCYSTVRIRAGRGRFADRHVARLVVGARDLDLGDADAAALVEGIHELAKAAFPDGEGIVRLQLSRDASGLRAVGIPRAIGPDRQSWRAVTAALPHDGATLANGLKVTSRLTLSQASKQAAAAGVDEAVLADAAGRLVEGARSNLFVALEDGTLATPPGDSGAVMGIGRTVCLERIPEIVQRPIPMALLRDATELVAVNSVRGALPIVELDGKPFADATPGPWSRRLAEALSHD